MPPEEPNYREPREIDDTDLQRAIEQLEGYRDWETDRKSTRLNSSHRL